MKKGVIIVGSVVLVAGVAYFLYKHFTKKNFDKRCIEGGGKLEVSGERCDFTKCDEDKFRCNMNKS